MKATSKDVAGSKHKSTVEPNNLQKINQGHGDSNGVDNQIRTKKGLISGRNSLQKEFDKEQQSGGSDMDSFVSTLGDLKDIDSKGSDNEGGSVEQVKTKSKGKDTADDDASSRNNDEEDDLSSFDFNAAENMEESAGMELSPVLLPRRESIGSDRPTSNRQPPVIRVGNVGSSAVVSGRKTQRANNYTEKEDLLLTKAYVSVSNDPINGSQQRANIFWAKVHEKYKVLVSQQVPKAGFVGRPVASLKQRYLKVIAKAVAKYNKFYHLLKNQNKSGWTQDDYIEEAARLYEEEEGKPFRFALCVEVLHQVPKFDPMVDQEELSSRGKRVNNAALPQGATINHPIGSKKAKIVQYLKDSGVVVTDDRKSPNDNLSVSNKSATDDISRRLEKNYSQRERQLKLKRIDLYIKLGQMDKANALMKEVEDEEERMNRVDEESAPANNEEPIITGDRGRMPPLPPLNEVTVRDNQIVESQLTGTSI